MQLPESATGTVVGTQTKTTIEESTRVYTTLSKSDPYLVQRLVGYFEYSQALNYLDRLVAMCDTYELAAVEEIVRSEPEFAIYTVSAEQAPSPKKSTTAVAEESGRKRHGLKWITALARVELGAMYAGFTESPRPFSHASSPGYDAAECKTLLAEGARIHFWSLTRDPVFFALTKRFRANSMTLAYLRRLNVATAFALASGRSSLRDELQNLAEMSDYATRLNAAREAIQAQIALYLAEVQVSTRRKTKTTSSNQALARLCNQGVCRTFDTSK